MKDKIKPKGQTGVNVKSGASIPIKVKRGATIPQKPQPKPYPKSKER